MRALITGFTGQVGSQLADFLLEATEYDVHGLMRWQEPIDNILGLTNRINKKDRVFIEYGDLNDLTSLVKAIKRVQPDFIFHLAAQSYPKTSFDSPIETLQTNIIGTANVLESVLNCRDENKNYNPTVHICSSSEVYGRTQKGTTLTEHTKLHATSPYSVSKICTDYLGQFYAEAYGLKTFVTRMGTHSGPRRSDVFFESTVAKQIALIEAGFQKPVIHVGNLNSVRTFQDVRDAVRAYHLLSLAVQDKTVSSGEVFNIAGREAFRLTEVVDLLLGMSSVDNIEVSVSEDRLRPIDADYQMFDNSKIRSVIDWEPEISAKQMFRDLLNHWRDQVKTGRVPLSR